MMTAVVAMAFMTACGTKPAETQTQSEQPETVCEDVVSDEAAVAEETVPEAVEGAAEEAVETTVEEVAETDAAEEPVFKIVSTSAKAPCSDQELMQMLTLKAKDVAPDAEPGRAVLEIIIEKDGSIRHATVKRSSGNEQLDAAAVEAVKKLPAFTPAEQNGHPVRTSLIVPVRFV